MSRRFRGRAINPGDQVGFNQTLVFPNTSNQPGTTPTIIQDDIEPGLISIGLLDSNGDYLDTSRLILVDFPFPVLIENIPDEGEGIPFGYINPGRLLGSVPSNEQVQWNYIFAPDGDGPGFYPRLYTDGQFYMIYTLDETMHPGIATLTATVAGIETNTVNINITTID